MVSNTILLYCCINNAAHGQPQVKVKDSDLCIGPGTIYYIRLYCFIRYNIYDMV